MINLCAMVNDGNAYNKTILNCKCSCLAALVTPRYEMVYRQNCPLNQTIFIHVYITYITKILYFSILILMRVIIRYLKFSIRILILGVCIILVTLILYDRMSHIINMTYCIWIWTFCTRSPRIFFLYWDIDW